MQSWDCSSCTFRHQAHATRCVMCNELRVSRENMRDFIIGKSTTTTTTTTSASTHQPNSTSYPLVSIDNLVSNRSTAVETGLNSSVINNSENLPNQTHIPRTTQRPSTATISRNPYRSKPSKSSTSAVPIPISHPNTNNTNNASLHPPQQPSINVPPAVSHPSVPNQNLNPAIVTNTAVASGQRIAPSTTNKRPRHSFIGNKLVPSNQKVRKRPKSLPKTIVLPYQPGPVPLANECADTWIYPVVAAYPKRQYQYDITCAAIQQNTLVSLPTGLGKTLIAAVVLYNFYRWYPTGKVLFLAPTLPLVDQQVQACYEIMGIPASDTALLTGKVPAVQRTTIWKERRVFFCTPQTVQRDLEANRCDALQVVCVVLDEAHKSTGEYAYCKVISHLEKAGAKFRVVGLSATPGTSIKAVQNVINVLRINCVEARSDNDPDVKQYIHDRQTDVVVVKGMDATKDVENKLNEIIGPLLDILRKRNVILPQFTDHKAISSYTLLKCQAFITSQPQNQRDNAAIGYLSAGICFLQIRTDLHKHGIGTVRSKLQKLQNDRPRGPLATIVKGDTFQALWNEVDNVSCNPNAVDNNLEAKYKNNPKLKKLCEILVDHFEKSKAASTSSRVIVFSQFRTSVSEIVDVLNESKPLIRARHFIGQGKSGGGTGTKATKQKTGGEQQQQLMDGMKQDEQKNVIARFKDGVYNTLVCTSIGEEGRKYLSLCNAY